MSPRAAAAILMLGIGAAGCTQTSSPSPSPAAPAGAAATEPARAEYAVRWDPAQGGPGSPDEVLAFLGAPRRSPTTFEIQYFDLPMPAGAPPDSTVILRRRRSEKGKTEIRLKYRRSAPLGKNWACPPGMPFERKEEVDVSFTSADAPVRVYSYSCTLGDGEPPATLAATPKKCAARMARYESEDFRVEAWTFSGGKAQLEISVSGRNTAEALAAFGRVVARLRESGVKPADRSKTEAGSDCAEAGGAP